MPLKISGVYKPKVFWMWRSIILLLTSLSLPSLKVNKLTMKTKVSIPETIRQDKGSYMLTAENCFGKAQHTIHVEILGKESSITPSVSLAVF